MRSIAAFARSRSVGDAGDWALGKVGRHKKSPTASGYMRMRSDFTVSEQRPGQVRGRRWVSAVAYPVEVVLFPKPIRRNVEGPVGCWPLGDPYEIARSATKSGGERGIRTPGTLPGTAVFKTAAFDRSAISPRRIAPEFARFPSDWQLGAPRVTGSVTFTSRANRLNSLYPAVLSPGAVLRSSGFAGSEIRQADVSGLLGRADAARRRSSAGSPLRGSALMRPRTRLA